MLSNLYYFAKLLEILMKQLCKYKEAYFGNSNYNSLYFVLWIIILLCITCY